MKFDIIATQEHSHADFSALLAFSSSEEATISTKAINDSQWANTQSLTPGQSGAFQVRKHVMFNTYSKAAYGEIIDMLKKLPVPATDGDISKLYKEMWTSLVDLDAPYGEARDFAIMLFAKALPGATVETMGNDEEDNMVIITYRGEVFRAQLLCDDEYTRIKVFASGIPDFSKPSFSIYEGNEDIRKIFDDFIEGTESSRTTPETAMFAAMKDIDFTKALPKNTERKLKGIANLFLQSWLKEAALVGVEASDDIAAVNWVEVWFQYKGKKFHVDFCTVDGNNTLCLYATNKYQENIDCAYVTVDTLQEKIDSVDDTGHFPGFPRPITREDAYERDQEIPRKSLEDRVARLETLVGQIQEEIKTIKKHI